MEDSLRSPQNHSNKPRILMLHGRQQNKELFKSRTSGKKRWIDENLVDLVYIQAPHKMQEKTETGEDTYMWWDAEIRDPEGKGFDQTVEYMKQVFKQYGPFDGIFGFSQGNRMFYCPYPSSIKCIDLAITE